MSVRYYLNSDFQKKIARKIISKYKTQRKAARYIGISQPELYFILKCRRKSILEESLIRLLNGCSMEIKSIKKFIIKTENEDDYRKELAFNMNKPKKKASELDVDGTQVISGNTLDVHKLLLESGYLKGLESCKGLVKLLKKPEIKNGKIILKLRVFNPRLRKFINKRISLPPKITVEKELSYFLGLTMGDGLGKHRMGVINKNLDVLDFVFNFLLNFFKRDDIIGSVFIHKRSEMKNKINHIKKLRKIGIKRFKLVKNFRAYGSFVYSVYVNCQPFSKILLYLIRKIKIIWPNLDTTVRDAFIAGLFDAEGNVNQRDRILRISQMTPINIDIIKFILTHEGYKFRFDGANFIIGYKGFKERDFKIFKNQVIPHMKHNDKVNKARIIIEDSLKGV